MKYRPAPELTAALEQLAKETGRLEIKVTPGAGRDEVKIADGGVQVLNVIKGDELIVESPAGAFEPFIVHYAETFIVPACVGAYTIRPYGSSVGKYCGTIKAYVRFRQ